MQTFGTALYMYANAQQQMSAVWTISCLALLCCVHSAVQSMLQVPCELATIEKLLGMVPKERKMLADLRYLQLLLAEPDYLQGELCSLVEMRLRRVIGSHVDLEVPYHPITLALFQARCSSHCFGILTAPLISLHVSSAIRL